jgi:hypothetical protein
MPDRQFGTGVIAGVDFSVSDAHSLFSSGFGGRSD